MNAFAPAKIDVAKTKLKLEHKHDRPLTACHWEPTAKFIFFGSQDNHVHRFDVAAKKAEPLEAHDSWVRAFGSSPDGARLYSGGYDGRLGFWPATVETPKPERLIDAHQGWLRAIAVSLDGSRVATCGNDRKVKLWDAADGRLVAEHQLHKSHVYNVVFSPDGGSVFSCDLKGVVVAWDIKAEQQREMLTVKDLHIYDKGFRADIGGARGIAVTADGQRLALGGITKVTNAFAGVGEVAIALVTVGDGKLERLLKAKSKTRGVIWGVEHHPEGFWIGLAGGGGGGWLYFWKGDAEHEFFKLKLKASGRGLSVSPDRTQVAVAHADGRLRTYALHA